MGGSTQCQDGASLSLETVLTSVSSCIENERAYNAFQQDKVPHQAKVSHEMVGGAAAFFAMRK